MINITKQGNNVIVTSDNPNSFHIGNGELSVPLNTIYYVLDDESDFIQFNSTEEGRILFNGTIGDIQVNGNIVNRENILMELDNVFNSAATGGEGGTAGVLSINGYDGYINIKSINGQSLIGSGDIEISGGEPEQYIKMLGEEYANNIIWYTNENDDYKEIKFKTINGNQIMGEGDITIEGGEGGTAGVEALNIGIDVQDWTQKTGIVTLYTQMYDGSYEVAADGMSFFGLKPADNTIIIEEGDGTVNGCFRGSIRVNPDVLGGGGTETDPVFTEWKESGSISIGENNKSEAGSINIGQNNENATAYSILIGQFVTATTGTSPIIIGSDTQSHNDEEILLGISPLSRTGSTDAEKTHVAFSKFNSDPSRSSNCFEIRNDNSVYIWDSNNTEMIKLQDYLSKEWTGTQAEYDALGTYDDNTTYYIIEG